MAEDAPDLVIVDLQMGNMGGMAVCLDLRLEESYGNLPHVPVLMLLDRRADVFLARRSGAEGWLVKPLDPIRLRRAAAAVVGGGTFHDESFQPVPVLVDVQGDAAPGIAPAATEPLPTVFRRREGSPEDRPPGSRARARQAPGGARAKDRSSSSWRRCNDLRDTTVREVMTPRVDVVGLPIPVQAADVARAVRQTGHSSFPVYDDDLDHLIGILFVNDLFRSGWELDVGNGNGGRGNERPTPLDISRRLRQPYLVPESASSSTCWPTCAATGGPSPSWSTSTAAWPACSLSRTSWPPWSATCATSSTPGASPRSSAWTVPRWLVDGGANIDDVREQVGMSVPEGEYVTLGGFLFDAFGHIPEEGERLQLRRVGAARGRDGPAARGQGGGPGGRGRGRRRGPGRSRRRLTHRRGAGLRVWHYHRAVAGTVHRSGERRRPPADGL